MKYRVMEKNGTYWVEKFSEPKWWRRSGWIPVKEFNSDYSPMMWVSEEGAINYMKSLSSKPQLVCETK